MGQEIVDVEKPVFKRSIPGTNQTFSTRGKPTSPIESPYIHDPFKGMNSEEIQTQKENDAVDQELDQATDEDFLPPQDPNQDPAPGWIQDWYKIINGEPLGGHGSSLHPPGEIAQTAENDPTTVTDGDREIAAIAGTNENKQHINDADMEAMAASSGDLRPEKTVIEAMRSSEDPELLEHATKEGVGILSAAASAFRGLVKYEMDEEHGWLSKLAQPLSIGGQIIAKEAAVVLKGIGELTEEEAKTVLAQTSVMPSDVVDLLIQKQPGGKEFLENMHSYAPTTHTVAKILIDVFSDPLTYLAAPVKGIGKLVDASGAVIDASKISASERAFLASGGRMVDITNNLNSAIKSNYAAKVNEAWSETKKLAFMARADEITNVNLKQLADYSKEKISLEDFAMSLRGPGAKEARDSIRDAWKWANSDIPLFEGLATGQRTLGFRTRIPFTNATYFTEIPHLGKATGKFIQAATTVGAWTGSLLAAPFKLVEKMTGVDFFDSAIRAANVFGKGLLTKTGLYDIDTATSIFHHTDTAGQMAREDFLKRWSPIMKEWDQSHIRDVIDEMEFSVDDVYETMRRSKIIPFEADAAAIAKDGEQIFTPIKLTKTFETAIERITRKPEDIARLERLSLEQRKLVEEINHMMKTAADEYHARGIPFDDLKVFDPNWKPGHAVNYLPHIQTESYMATQSLTHDEAIERFVQWTNKVDRGALGREYRGGINEANDAALKSLGIKIYVDNPLELAIYRHKRMMDTVRRHDLIESVLPHIVTDKDVIKMNPGRYIPITPEHWSSFAAESAKNIQPDYFLPSGFRPFASGQKSGWLPVEVYERLRFMTNPEAPSGPFMSVINKGMDAWNWFFRNMALSGPGYLGMNAMSNAVRFSMIPFGNSFKQSRATLEATWLLTPRFEKISPTFIKIAGEDGKIVELTREQMLSIAAEAGIINVGQAHELSTYALAEAKAGTYAQREKIYEIPLSGMWDHIRNSVTGKNIGERVKNAYGQAPLISRNLLDVMAGWRTSRAVAQYTDDIPKLAVFIDRLRDGYSVEAARDAANMYFYDFKNVGPSHAQARRLFSFSSFAMKTAEAEMEIAKEIGLGRLAIPNKAYHVLHGAFVPDQNTQERLNEITPKYMLMGQDVWHGILMPGGFEATLEAPFYQNSLNYIFDPLGGVHPLLAMLMNFVASKTPDSELAGYNFYDSIKRGPEDSATPAPVAGADQWNGWSRFLWNSNLLPKWWLDSLALAEIHGAIDAGGFFANKYSPNLPISEDPNSSYNRKFNNAVELGKFWEERGGPGIFGKMIIGDADPYGGTKHDDLQHARVGNFVSSRIRDMSFGLIRMNNVDRGFFARLGALDRQLDFYKNEEKSNAVSLGYMVDPAELDDKAVLKNMGEGNRIRRKIYELQEKKSSLVQWYDFYSHVQKEYPQGGVWDLIFGSDRYHYDYTTYPDNILNPEKQPGRKELLDQMFPSAEDLMGTESENGGNNGQ